MQKKIRRCYDCRITLEEEDDERYCNECFLNHIDDVDSSTQDEEDDY